MTQRHFLVATALGLSVLCLGCSAPSAVQARTPRRPSATAVSPPPPRPSAADRAQARHVHANELGVVPVLMYHEIVPRRRGEFDRTPAEFRQELGALYVAGFRPVTAAEYVTGRFRLPAGTSPVVLTFDDAYRNQFARLADGRPDPSTAVGMLLAFARTHPGFRPVATMYVNREPFGTPRYAPLLRDLHARGFELGDHTFSHEPLGSKDDVAVQREIALGQRVITDVVPSAHVTTFALPLGVMPQHHQFARRGSSGGIRYAMDGVFRVGAGPAPSPYSRRFDPGGIPRIRSSAWTGGPPNFGSAYWLAWLRSHPGKRYVSDGDARFVSFPRSLASELGQRQPVVANAY
ncbi:MAG: polysaccharide deacetylase family protein [Mycobacteriales bacterium]|nr:polysaccharide deacetylase family protein [Frankia sp.]